ncbi:MAG TPA: MarR family transcriptional regulator [Gammaproteobacteria bacterium]|nr:MarR family transcriptional regulator [Gammaproteobacteria bacterium]
MTDLLQVVQECGFLRLREDGRVVTRVYDRFTQASGLKPTQFSLLVAASLIDRANVNQLAEIMAMERTTLTRNLRPLEKKGLIKVMAGEDRRTRLVIVTDAGRNAVKRALPLWKEAQGYMAKSLGAARWCMLREALDVTTRVKMPR